MDKAFWDDRYKGEGYVYGEAPNDHLKQQLQGLKPGKILFPAEGEGRNAVYAASFGWEVAAFDISEEGRRKAQALAQKHGVKIDYQISDFDAAEYEAGSFDAVALVYSHMSDEMKRRFLPKVDRWLKPGGVLIVEVYSKDHDRYQAHNLSAGGPREASWRYAIADFERYFGGYEIEQLEEVEVNLAEGTFHAGLGLVVRFVGRKRVV